MVVAATPSGFSERASNGQLDVEVHARRRAARAERRTMTGEIFFWQKSLDFFQTTFYILNLGPTGPRIISLAV